MIKNPIYDNNNKPVEIFVIKHYLVICEDIGYICVECMYDFIMLIEQFNYLEKYKSIICQYFESSRLKSIITIIGNSNIEPILDDVKEYGNGEYVVAYNNKDIGMGTIETLNNIGVWTIKYELN